MIDPNLKLFSIMLTIDGSPFFFQSLGTSFTGAMERIKNVFPTPHNITVEFANELYVEDFVRGATTLQSSSIQHLLTMVIKEEMVLRHPNLQEKMQEQFVTNCFFPGNHQSVVDFVSVKMAEEAPLEDISFENEASPVDFNAIAQELFKQSNTIIQSHTKLKLMGEIIDRNDPEFLYQHKNIFTHEEFEFLLSKIIV